MGITNSVELPLGGGGGETSGDTLVARVPLLMSRQRRGRAEPAWRGASSSQKPSLSLPTRRAQCLLWAPQVPELASDVPDHFSLMLPLFTSLPQQQKGSSRAGTTSVVHQPSFPHSWHNALHVSKWRHEYGFLGGFRVISIIHLFFDSRYVLRHGQDIREAKINCPWLMPSKSVWCGERINLDTWALGCRHAHGDSSVRRGTGPV